MTSQALTSPYSRKAIARFAAMPAEKQERIRLDANLRYDGSRTAAQCWKEAFAAEGERY